MKDECTHMDTKIQIVLPRVYLWLMTIALVFLLYLFAPVLKPFFIAALIAYLSNPVVDKLEQFKIPRILGVIIVFLLMLSLMTLIALFLIPLITDQINLLIHKLPIMIEWVQKTAIPWVNAKLGDGLDLKMENINRAVVEGLKAHQDMIGKIITTVTSSGFTIITVLFQTILVPVVTFYLLRDWNHLNHNLRHILPRRIEPTVVMLTKKYDEVLKSFLRGQLLVIIILGGIYTTGLWLVGLQFAILIGLMAGLLNIVPYLGFSVGLITGLIAAYYQFQDLTHLIYVLIVFMVGQSIESMLLTPLLVGDSIGLHPVAVIFAVLTGGYFFGLIGALIALPVAAAIMVLVRYGLTKYYKSTLYS